MARTWAFGVLLLTGCATQYDLDQANARVRAMRGRQRVLEQRLHVLETELARRFEREQGRSPGAPAAPAPAPVEHVVVVRIERGDDVAATVDLDPVPSDENGPRVPRIEEELISPWPREARPRPDVGMLRIGAQGFFCAASIDGIPVGNTPIAIRTVRVGAHDVTCANANLAYEQTKAVTVERGERTVVLFER